MKCLSRKDCVYSNRDFLVLQRSFGVWMLVLWNFVRMECTADCYNANARVFYSQGKYQKALIGFQKDNDDQRKGDVFICLV